MKEHIFVTHQIPQVGIDLLQEKGYEVDVYKKKTVITQSEIIAQLKKKPYKALLCFLTDTIDKKVFDACPTLAIVATYSVGFNAIDIVEAKKRGIVVANTPGLSAMAVAEYTVAMMLALSTRLVEADRFVRAGKYQHWDPFAFIGIDIQGSTIGLIGGGAIATEVARILHSGFGAKIVYYDVVQNPRLEKKYKAQYCKTLDEVLAQSDIVSLHVPLLPSTTHLINAKNLAKMKKTAYLINTARGPVIDEKALVSALKKKVIAGAALDVFEHEPALTTGLASLPQVILTPHIASARASVRNQMSLTAAQNIIDVLTKGKTKNNVWQH